MTQIKICGITSLEDALSAIEFGAKYLGFIFAKESPRYIDPEKAQKIISSVNSACQTVAVFRNEPEASVEHIVSHLRPHFIQLHGQEPSQYCQRIVYPKIKAIEIQEDMSEEVLAAQIKIYRGVSDILLFDRPKEVGMELWLHSTIRLLNDLEDLPPFFFAGGLTAHNVAFAVGRLHPMAVDVASGVESSPGKKDPVKLKAFCNAVNNLGKSEARRV